jgi:hypothetical protein
MTGALRITTRKILFLLVTRSRRVSVDIPHRPSSCLEIFTVSLRETLFTIPQTFGIGLTNQTYLSKFDIFACHD